MTSSAPLPPPVPPPADTASPLQAASPVACDIFCAVVDNFGDIGVCWRLARQLALEHGWQVRIFVDALATFARLQPAALPDAARQTVDGIVVEHWRAPAHAGDTLEIADIVIEAFAASCRARMSPRWRAARGRPSGSTSNT